MKMSNAITDELINKAYRDMYKDTELLAGWFVAIAIFKSSKVELKTL